MVETKPYKPKNKIRIVTAASLFDGHDAAINIMRRIIQASGAEVIHLGHDRSVKEIVDCAIQEDAQAIAITSYQGGHMEFFKYMYDLLKKSGCGHIKIFGGGGGTILPEEIKELHKYGIARIYTPDDGRSMGLQGMINDLVMKASSPAPQRGEAGILSNGWIKNLKNRDWKTIAQLISCAENSQKEFQKICPELLKSFRTNVAKPTHPSKMGFVHDGFSPSGGIRGAVVSPVLGITGTGGSGKSSLADELVRRFLADFKDKTIAIISVDPSKKKTGGALLGDRIRMNSILNDRVYMRSLATRQSNLALSKYVQEALNVLKAAEYDLIILETSGIGQSDTEILDHSDLSLYVMTPEYGAATQLEKIDMLDFADIIALNKFDKRGAQDALRDVKKQFKRNHKKFKVPDDKLPVFGTIASQFNDPGMNRLYAEVMQKISEKTGVKFQSKLAISDEMSEKLFIIPPSRIRYLSEISENNRSYDQWVAEQSEIANKMYALDSTIQHLTKSKIDDKDRIIKKLKEESANLDKKLDSTAKEILKSWQKKTKQYKGEYYIFKVRGKEIKIKTHTESLSHTQIPKVAVPRYEAWGEILRWVFTENFPGEFPYAAGVYPFKRTEEDPARMFAGEGGPERTNKRFHYVSTGLPAKRLSTAFDSVTLYGRDPDLRPDIYGKIGNSGVSICCLDDAKKLFSGFNLADSKTSVSMTINGPAPTLTAFFMNAAIDQQCEIYIKQNGLEKQVDKKISDIFKKNGTKRPSYQGKLPAGNEAIGLMLLGVTGDQVLPKEVYQTIKVETLKQVRGTVQADILKEDQAQNTCIFSTEFSLRVMGDVQQYFIENNIRNFYSVSISGYHIAEAGANPITQLAFTLANGFTYVEYYLSRGMKIDDFAPNLSFFFSNGIDPEYAVIGRVARRIWAKAMKNKYKGNERSQMLKYHIQTSGRSLHAQEIDFNDIRTTLQALYAIYDNCNSLHTNAYDEAITTPTEESVRRAMAIQLIINKELGLSKNENPLQGSFIVEELTDLVETAVLAEFDKITERGGVLGAMETMYQRGKIQEESLYYETLKHTGEFPIIGVNTYLSSKGSPTVLPKEVIRATEEEKKYQISMLNQLHKGNKEIAIKLLRELQLASVQNKNIFEALMEAAKYCSLGQITSALFEVGGQYRRNM
ncbi:MAG: methylmalonyl-CoA mutase [Bacteroidetes bacterium]|nr:MAG: methylmalonyl-CoA mutase [Bacteroidota bacterium]